MTRVRICLVRKILPSSVEAKDCLESIRFDDKEELFEFPEALQPLKNHPEIAENSKIVKIVETMKELYQLRFIRINLSEEHRELYLDENGNFRFAGQLLAKGTDRSKIRPREPPTRDISQNSACVFKDMGCTFEGTSSALEVHLGSHLSLMAALVSTQQAEMERQAMVISDQRERLLEQKSEISSFRISHHLTLNSSGCFIWRIPNCEERYEKARTDENYILGSEPFLSSNYGYTLRAFLMPNVSGNDSDDDVGLLVLPGMYDSILRWPIPISATLTLLDQADSPDEVFFSDSI